MSNAANVRSVDAIRAFYADLCTFSQAAVDAVSSVDMEARRFVDWLQNEQRLHWQTELRKRMEEVVEAKNALSRKERSHVGDRKPDTSLEEAELRRAKMRVMQAEEKLELLQKWLRAVEKGFDEFRGDSRQLLDFVEGNPPPPAAALEKILSAIDEYMALQAPTGTPRNIPSSSPARGEVAQPPPSKPAADSTNPQPQEEKRSE